MMRLSTAVPTAADLGQYSAPATLRAIVRWLGAMVASVEPAVVFTSAVKLCVPLICDAASVTLTGSEQQPCDITWPRNTTDHCHPPTATVRTLITGQSTEEHPAYGGTLTLHFQTPPRDDHAVLSQLVVDRATELVQRERLIELADSATTRAAHLAAALASNRDIGVAIGILMSLHKITKEDAFDKLREVSQQTQRKLRDIAIDVAETGTVETLGHGAPLAPLRAARIATDRASLRLSNHRPS
jgi:hypothetical protein